MNRNQPVRLEEIAYYFDAVAQDRIDRGALSVKHGEILSLKDQLLSLPPAEFQAVISTVKGLIRDKHDGSEERRKPARTPQSSLALYEKSKDKAAPASDAVPRI